MTKEEALVLDLLVARLMGWDHKHDVREHDDMYYEYCRNCQKTGADDIRWDFDWKEKECFRPPHYSTDIARAWTVWEKIEPETGWLLGAWFDPLKAVLQYDEVGAGHEMAIVVEGDTYQEAICRAALVLHKPL